MIPFVADARAAFDPVATAFGLFCVKETDWFLRYENQKVFFHILYDNGSSFELGIEIGLNQSGAAERPFSLQEVLRSSGIETNHGFFAKTTEALNEQLARLSSITANYAERFLSGDHSSFGIVADLRLTESKKFLIEGNLRAARSTADEAWSVKNYRCFVNLLAPLRPHLSLAEKKKLDFAIKKLS